MKQTHILFISEEINLDNLASATKDIGVIKEASGAIFQCRLTRGNKHIWIFKDDSLHEVYEDMNKLEEITQKLGDNPVKTFFVLELSSSNQNHDLLLELLCKLARQFCIAWEDFEENIHSYDEIRSGCRLN